MALRDFGSEDGRQLGNSFLNSIRSALGEEFADCSCDQVNALA